MVPGKKRDTRLEASSSDAQFATQWNVARTSHRMVASVATEERARRDGEIEAVSRADCVARRDDEAVAGSES
jgi:hypothetical protein